MRRTIVALGAAAGLAACVAAYHEPRGEDLATLNFSKGYDKGAALGASSLQMYFLLPKGSCAGKQRIAHFTWTTGSAVAKRVPAGQPVTIQAYVERLTNFQRGSCENGVTFTPKPGASYRVSQDTKVWAYCQITVTDIATNRPPEDAHASSMRCGF